MYNREEKISMLTSDKYLGIAAVLPYRSGWWNTLAVHMIVE